MSPQLKPLLLPQLVQERRKMEDHQDIPFSEDDLPFTSHTTNSSSSDIVSPVTPTFSTRGHFRGSSSSSSLDLAYSQLSDGPASPTPQLSKKPSKRQLPDVAEEPVDRDEDRTLIPDFSDLGLYSCLCDEPCEHQSGTESRFSGDSIPDHDFDFDLGGLSDGDLSSTSRSSRRNDSLDSPFLGLTSRLGSRLNTMSRFKPSRRPTLMSTPTTEVNFENVMSRGRSSRSSSLSSPQRHHFPDRSLELPSLVTPSMSRYNSVDSVDSFCGIAEEVAEEDKRTTLERDRAKATTPLLPPLVKDYFGESPDDSTLYYPSVAQPSAIYEVQPVSATSINFPRPSLSTKPSVSSLRNVPSAMDLPLPLPALLQEHDEWSDRLGHANFTITPEPYELDQVNPETIAKFREDWEAAKINYTKHLVRTGENYGETSKIYGLTEDKWAETEGRWKATYENAFKEAAPFISSAVSYTARPAPRNRSRGRGRGRSGSVGASILGRPANDDSYAEMQWHRLEDSIPCAVPRMMDPEGKFPERGDEDIVGPMHRAETMVRSQSEDKHGAKFWKNLAGKVGLLK